MEVISLFLWETTVVQWDPNGAISAHVHIHTHVHTHGHTFPQPSWPVSAVYSIFLATIINSKKTPDPKFMVFSKDGGEFVPVLAYKVLRSYKPRSLTSSPDSWRKLSEEWSQHRKVNRTEKRRKLLMTLPEFLSPGLPETN